MSMEHWWNDTDTEQQKYLENHPTQTSLGSNQDLRDKRPATKCQSYGGVSELDLCLNNKIQFVPRSKHIPSQFIKTKKLITCIVSVIRKTKMRFVGRNLRPVSHTLIAV